MRKKTENGIDKIKTKVVRADAQRNMTLLLETARDVFATSGVDAPVREIAEKAGVGLGTVYRHFPQRSDLIAAVMRHEVDACAEAAQNLSAQHSPGDALTKWIHRYATFVAAKRGLAPALHSGNPAYEGLREYFEQRVRPALRTLVASAKDSGSIRKDADADDILTAVSSLCMSTAGGERTQRMVALFIDGLRYGAETDSSR